MKKYILTIGLILFSALACLAQNPYGGEIRVVFGDNIKEGEEVTLSAIIDLEDLVMDRNSIITFTPALRSLDGENEIVFDSLMISGTRRMKSIRRSDYFDHKTSVASSDNFSVITPGEQAGTIPLEYSVPFKKWMRQARMEVVEQTAGCSDYQMLYSDGQDFKLYAGVPASFPAPFQPSYIVSYIVPDVLPVKTLSETHAARLQFVVNRTELLRDFADNRRILDEADEVIGRIKNDSLLTVRSIIVSGYASPEGGTANNQRLSEGRAQAFVNYLHERHNFRQADNMIRATGYGEDWAGLRAVVEGLDISDRQRVLEIIDNEPYTNTRKNKLKALSGGRTYRMLLTEHYPPLRRNEYTIEYDVRGFNAEEARQFVWTRPQLLSLNEFFMVAGLYDPKSPEYKEVFDIAARMYPDSPVAQFNTGAMEVENGSYDSAIRRLSAIDTPEAWNNLGVAYWEKGEYDKSLEYFNKSAESGLESGLYNREQYRLWDDDRDE